MSRFLQRDAGGRTLVADGAERGGGGAASRASGELRGVGAASPASGELRAGGAASRASGELAHDQERVTDRLLDVYARL